MIHVCSLSRLHETVAATGARHVVTLLKDVELVQRPGGISSENHLILGMDDITGPLEGYIAPGDEHVAKLIAFVRGWDREGRMKATSVVDVVDVGTAAPDAGGRRFASAGGIAHAGSRRISRVEVRVDEGEWRAARLREPRS